MHADESGLHNIPAVDALTEAHRAQCIEYLKVRGLMLGFMINFGIERRQIERVANQM